MNSIKLKLIFLMLKNDENFVKYIYLKKLNNLILIEQKLNFW